jgi:hypothetical protein
MRPLIAARTQCFHNLYFTEAGGRRKARENIGDFAGSQSDSKQKKHFVMNPPSLFGKQLHRPGKHRLGCLRVETNWSSGLGVVHKGTERGRGEGRRGKSAHHYANEAVITLVYHVIAYGPDSVFTMVRKMQKAGTFSS